MFTIWYGDGTRFTETDGTAFDAPGLNAQVVEQADPVTGRWSQMGHDYYVWTGEQWVGCDVFGLFDYLQQPGPRKVIFGRTIGNAEYEAIWRAAEADVRFPARSYWRAGEFRDGRGVP